MTTLTVNGVEYYVKRDADIGGEVRKRLGTPGALEAFRLMDHFDLVMNAAQFSMGAGNAYDSHLAKMFVGNDAYMIITKELLDLQKNFQVTTVRIK